MPKYKEGDILIDKSEYIPFFFKIEKISNKYYHYISLTNSSLKDGLIAGEKTKCEIFIIDDSKSFLKVTDFNEEIALLLYK